MNVVLYLNWFYVIQYQYNTAVIFFSKSFKFSKYV